MLRVEINVLNVTTTAESKCQGHGGLDPLSLFDI